MSGVLHATSVNRNRGAMQRAMTAVLTHPIPMALKRHVREVRWRWVGRTVVNPPVPPHVTSVLFVCLGNICRSPFAAVLAERVAVETGRGWMRFASAGIRTSQGRRSPQDACRAAARFGIDLESHAPQPLTSELMTAHDAIVVMEASHLAQLRTDYADCSDRIFLLPLCDVRARGAYESFNIADPFGQTPAAFDECYRRIARAVRRWLDLIPPSSTPRSNHS